MVAQNYPNNNTQTHAALMPLMLITRSRAPGATRANRARSDGCIHHRSLPELEVKRHYGGTGLRQPGLDQFEGRVRGWIRVTSVLQTQSPP